MFIGENLEKAKQFYTVFKLLIVLPSRENHCSSLFVTFYKIIHIIKFCTLLYLCNIASLNIFQRCNFCF